MPPEPTTTIAIRPETARLIGELGRMLRLKTNASEHVSDADRIHKSVRHVVLRLRKIRAARKTEPRT